MHLYHNSQVFDESGVSSYIDGSDPKYGNWMSLIQCARSREEQNLKLRQQVTHKGVQLYFVVTRDIDHGQELLVWYDTEQVNLYYGLPLSLKSMEGAEDDREKINTTASVKTGECTTSSLCLGLVSLCIKRAVYAFLSN